MCPVFININDRAKLRKCVQIIIILNLQKHSIPIVTKV